MNQEIEIQAKIFDPVDAENKIAKVGKFIKERKQIDKYFVTPQNDFFSKNPPIEYLRIRQEDGKNHLNYSYLHFDDKGFLKVTDEYETLVDKPETVEEIFNKIGLINKVTVVKTRKYFECDGFEVTLDNVEGLGDFMEVEAKKDFGGVDATRTACQKFLDDLGIKYEVKKEMGYPRMLYKKMNSI